MENIKELSVWEISDTVQSRDGYDSKTIPEATSKNMDIFFNKLNEIVKVVNKQTNGKLYTEEEIEDVRSEAYSEGYSAACQDGI